MADQRAEAAEFGRRGCRRVKYRWLQHRRGGNQPVLGNVIGQCRLLRQHLPAAVGIALADAPHLLALAPGGGNEHVAAETAAPHRLHAVIQIAQRRADLDLHRLQFGPRLGPGRFTEVWGGDHGGDLRIAQLVDDQPGLAAVGSGQVGGGVLAAEHRPGGEIDGLQHLLPARRRGALSAQQPAPEFKLGLAVVARQVRGHRIAHPPAQVGLPVGKGVVADQPVDAGKHRRFGQRDLVGADPLGLEEIAKAQVAVLAVQAGYRHRGVVVERVVDPGQRLRRGGQRGFQCQHRIGFALQAVGRGAGQGEDLFDVITVTAAHALDRGIVTGVEGRIRQPGAALHEISQVAIQRLQVDIGVEVEGHRDTDLVQGGDGGW